MQAADDVAQQHCRNLWIMVVESKVSGSHPTAVLEKRGLSVAKYSQCSKVVHRRYIGDVSNSELQKRTVVF
jgi:lipoprotein NlpI